MNAKCYSFKVGRVDCMILLDGATVLTKARVMKRFPNVTEAELRQAYADLGQSLDQADSSFNVLVAKIGGETVLVDTGEGGRPSGGYLLESMRLAGIDPEAITRVVITHADGDHIQGLLSDDKKPAFPNATYVLSSAERAFWQQRIDDSAADQRPIVTMMEERGLHLIDLEEQIIILGLTAVPIRGHTPGQIAVLVESEGEKLIHLADLLHSPIQIARPERSASFDLDTRVSVPLRMSTC